MKTDGGILDDQREFTFDRQLINNFDKNYSSKLIKHPVAQGWTSISQSEMSPMQMHHQHKNRIRSFDANSRCFCDVISVSVSDDSRW